MLFSSLFGDWIVQEITDTLRDHQSYDAWLRSNQGMMERISSKVRGDIGEILPKIGSKYRDLIITWAGDPKNVIAVVGLLKGVLGLAW